MPAVYKKGAILRGRLTHMGLPRPRAFVFPEDRFFIECSAEGGLGQSGDGEWMWITLVLLWTPLEPVWKVCVDNQA